VNAPWPGAPNPNAAGVVPFCPCPGATKLKGDPAPPPVDVEGVTGVNTNEGGLDAVVSFVVLGVLGMPKENADLLVGGAGVDGVVVLLNALTGVGVVPNALPFITGLGPGLEVSCLGAANENMPGEVPVVVEMVGFEDGKLTFKSDPPVGLFVPKLNGG